MIVGMEAVFPNGKICRIKNVPRRAAGPDIRHIICGNEGALCLITDSSNGSRKTTVTLDSNWTMTR